MSCEVGLGSDIRAYSVRYRCTARGAICGTEDGLLDMTRRRLAGGVVVVCGAEGLIA
jgi:hypothetical protein